MNYRWGYGRIDTSIVNTNIKFRVGVCRLYSISVIHMYLQLINLRVATTHRKKGFLLRNNWQKFVKSTEEGKKTNVNFKLFLCNCMYGLFTLAFITQYDLGIYVTLYKYIILFIGHISIII